MRPAKQTDYRWKRSANASLSQLRTADCGPEKATSLTSIVNLELFHDFAEKLAHPQGTALGREPAKRFERINPILSLLQRTGITLAQSLDKPTGSLSRLQIVFPPWWRGRLCLGRHRDGQLRSDRLQGQDKFPATFAHPLLNHVPPNFA